ncbi:MAG: hypothetical protein CO119_02595 [Flavobacteriales bacterium CG_4_9_14_3_um_filter_40_17]|nr:MAG: hypothetical protein CO119_02595 [Flavobacteriales bacterium CG_4_9_14_3_um_filter_40_17]
MPEGIINRVTNSKLLTIDLEDYYVEGKRFLLDISKWLDEGLVLREKKFRETVGSNDWVVFKDGLVALHCSTDAIVPVWAYMLVSSKLSGIAAKTTLGTLEDLERELFIDQISRLNLSDYKDKNVIIKGCSKKPVPDFAYVLMTQKLELIAKAVLYGEACSSVPIFKKK